MVRVEFPKYSLPSDQKRQETLSKRMAGFTPEELLRCRAREAQVQDEIKQCRDLVVALGEDYSILYSGKDCLDL
jgi:hypothetical protein